VDREVALGAANVLPCLSPGYEGAPGRESVSREEEGSGPSQEVAEKNALGWPGSLSFGRELGRIQVATAQGL
jgi:hypothetical protein